MGAALRDELLELCADLLASEELPGASPWIRGYALEVLDIGPLRATYRVQRSEPPLVLKIYAPRGGIERLRARLRVTRAEHEAKVLREAARRGLPVPRVFGHASMRIGSVGRSALLMSDLGAGRSLDSGPLDTALAARAGELIATAHACGLRHGDLHLGNLFLGGDGKLSLLDLYKADFAGGAHRPTSRELLPLYLSLPWPEERELRAALFGPIGVEHSPAELKRWLDAHLTSRLARCRRSSGPFEVDGELRYRRGSLPEGGASTWRERLADAELRKSGRRGGVYRLSSGHWAKERDLQHARALWEAAFGLELRGVAAPRAVALVPTEPGRALVISEPLKGARPLDEAWRETDFDTRGAAAALGRGYARLHATGWRFRDGRGDNFAVLANGDVAFVDLDGAAPGDRAAADLGRLLAWLSFQAPARGDAAECVRSFLRAYLAARRAHGRGVDELRPFVRKIQKRSERWRRRHPTTGR